MDERSMRLAALGYAAGMMLAATSALALDAPADAPPQDLVPVVEQQLRAGDFEAAWQQLAPLRARHGRELWFADLISRAALGSGRHADAINLLSNALDEHPENDPLRFRLADAYLAAGNEAAAVRQWQLLEQASLREISRRTARAKLDARGIEPTPAAEVAALAAIPVPEIRPEDDPLQPISPLDDAGPALQGELFAAAGYDTNANSATDARRYLGFRLTEQNRKSNSPYLAGGGSVRYVLKGDGRLRWRSGGSYEARTNTHAHFADSHYFSAQSQLRWVEDAWRASAGLALSGGLIDDALTNRAIAIAADLDRIAGPALLGVGVELATWRFPDEAIRNVDSLILRLSAERSPEGATAPWQPTFTMLLGTEEPIEAASPFGRTLWGFDAGLRYHWSETLNAGTNVGLLLSNFDAPFSTTATDSRDDQRYEGGLSLSWRPDRRSKWAVGGMLRYVSNASNEPLYDFERVLVGLLLTRSLGMP